MADNEELTRRVALLESEARGEAALTRRLFEFLAGDRGRIDGVTANVAAVEIRVAAVEARLASLEASMQAGFSKLEIEMLKLRTEIPGIVARTVAETVRELFRERRGDA